MSLTQRVWWYIFSSPVPMFSTTSPNPFLPLLLLSMTITVHGFASLSKELGDAWNRRVQYLYGPQLHYIRVWKLDPACIPMPPAFLYHQLEIRIGYCVRCTCLIWKRNNLLAVVKGIFQSRHFENINDSVESSSYLMDPNLIPICEALSSMSYVFSFFVICEYLSLCLGKFVPSVLHSFIMLTAIIIRRV
jgi:hypothetical protein